MIVVHYSPHMHPGGPAALAADLSRTLQAEECGNIVISRGGEIISRLHSSGVLHIVCHRPNILTIWSEIRRIRKIIRQHEPDIIQVYSADAAWIVSRACRKIGSTKRPCIVGALTGYLPPAAQARAWKYCDFHTVISRHLGAVLQSDSTPFRCSPWVIPYGVDEDMCHPSYYPTDGWLNQWRGQHPLPAHTLKICIPGAISPLHGLEDIVHILTGLIRSGVSAHVFIEGDVRRALTTYVEELQDLFSSSQLADHITWLGARPDLRDVLCVCDVIVSLHRQPATYDRAILEALALGKPVVGYDVGVIGELLEAFQPEGRVTPGNTQAIIDTLLQWHSFTPTPITEIPYPYKMTDTAATYHKLYNHILSINRK